MPRFTSERECVVCGKTYVGYGRQKRCPDCKYKCRYCGGPLQEDGEIRDGRCKPCEAKLHRVHNKTISARLTYAKYHAKRRKIVFGLTREEFEQLATSPCDYCGHIDNTVGYGIDRLDESQGYVMGNVVPCCSLCNWLRATAITYQGMKEIFGPDVRKAREQGHILHRIQIPGRPRRYD